MYYVSMYQPFIYMDYIKLFVKNEKRTGDIDANNKNIQSGCWNGIWNLQMCHAHNEKWQKRYNGRNRTAKSRKNQNSWRKRKLQVLGDFRRGHQQTSGDRKKMRQSNEKTFRNQTLQQKSQLRDKKNIWAVLIIRYSVLFLKWTKEELKWTRGQKVVDCAQSLSGERWHKKTVSVKKRQGMRWSIKKRTRGY